MNRLIKGLFMVHRVIVEGGTQESCQRLRVSPFLLQNLRAVSKYFSQILKKKLRKEWSYFFDTLNKCFAGKCSSYDTINTIVLKI